jgi:uncharacterized cupredoxin-like copper-binding protein
MGGVAESNSAGTTVALAITLLAILSTCGEEGSPLASSPSGTATTAESASLVTPSETTIAEGPIAIELREFSITPEATALRSGKVRFDVENVGDYRHEFLVVKLVPGTNTPPTVATGAMKENAPGIDTLGRITKTTLTPGGNGELTLNLEPGDYIFACNLVIGEVGSNAPIESHYGRGMHTSFTVA